MSTITGTTNQTGYVTFANAIEGSYTLKILKAGYLPANQTINFTGQSMASTFSIFKASEEESGSNLLLIVIAVVIVVAVVVAVVVVIFVRRKRAARFKVPPNFPKKNRPPIGPAAPY